MSYRLQHAGVVVDARAALDFKRYPFIPYILDEDFTRLTIVKGAQMGFTIACIMKALEHAKSGKHRGIGYFFPTASEVTDFAKARWNPMMRDNPELWGQFVADDADSAGLKIIGNTTLYFRGAGQRGTGRSEKSTSKQKSMPLDEYYLDEADEMEDDRKDAIAYRTDAAENPQRTDLSTPTLPDWGVDYDYGKSDKSVWQWKCELCGHWTCLDLSYPDCIAQPNNKNPYLRCDHCKKELIRRKGEWVARETSVTDHKGLWASQLNSPTQSALTIVKKAVTALETGRKRQFENQTLARAFAEVDQAITEQQLNAMITTEERPLMHEGPASLGCDPGRPNWYEVAIRITELDSLVIARGKVDSLDELDKIWSQYNCESGVIDRAYDPSKVASFCKDHPGCYGALYVGGKTGEPDWDHKNQTVNLGRTRTLDDAHNLILAGRVKHIRKDEFWTEHYVPQMVNLKRASIVTNQQTGEERAIWVITGGRKNDHLRHADAYCQVALTRCGIAHEYRRGVKAARGSGKTKRPRSAMTA